MHLYPAILVSYSTYPELCISEVSNFFFLRRTNEDIYQYLQKYSKLELIERIIPEIPKRDIFVFSVSLYGYYNENNMKLVPDGHFNQNWNTLFPNIKPNDITYQIKEDCHPLFLRAQKLYEHSFRYEGERFFLSFWHRPTIANYWHFQLYTRDIEGNHLPRDPKPGEKESSQQKKNLKRIAAMVFEYLVSEAICYAFEARKYRSADFDMIAAKFNSHYQ
jgi:hypothetical protein